MKKKDIILNVIYLLCSIHLIVTSHFNDIIGIIDLFIGIVLFIDVFITCGDYMFTLMSEGLDEIIKEQEYDE